MSIYSKARTKLAMNTILVSLCVIIGIWLLLFVTDYIMFKCSMPLLFSKTRVEEIDGKRITTESGLGYYVVMDENNTSVLYLFGHKIK